MPDRTAENRAEVHENRKESIVSGLAGAVGLLWDQYSAFTSCEISQGADFDSHHGYC